MTGFYFGMSLAFLLIAFDNLPRSSEVFYGIVFLIITVFLIVKNKEWESW